MGCDTLLSSRQTLRWAGSKGSVSTTKRDADAKSAPSTLLQIHPLLLPEMELAIPFGV